MVDMDLLQGLDQIPCVLKDTVFVHIPRFNGVLADGAGAEQVRDLTLPPRPEVSNGNIAVDAELHGGVGRAVVPRSAVAADEVIKRVLHTACLIEVAEQERIGIVILEAPRVRGGQLCIGELAPIAGRRWQLSGRAGRKQARVPAAHIGDGVVAAHRRSGSHRPPMGHTVSRLLGV